MARRYFDKFPIVNYNGYNVRDLTKSAKLVNKYASLPYVYTPYTIEPGQRADTVADKFYDDQYMTWMIYYSNRIVDPYYDWFMSDDQFNDFLVEKYGSIPYTYQKICGFRTSWYEDDRRLTPNQFLSMFGDYTAPHSYYWNPVYDDDTNRVLYYVRKQVDNFVNTNKVTRVEADGTSFSTGDLVLFYSDDRAVGNGEVVTANSSQVTMRHILGDLDTGYDIVLGGNTSQNTAVLTFSGDDSLESNTWTITNISDEEYVYWSPYFINDVETNRNSQNKNIKLVDPAVAVKVADSLEANLKSED